jgi:hypothetical protein
VDALVVALVAALVAALVLPGTPRSSPRTASSIPLAADFRSRRLLLPSDARGSGAFSLPFLLCWNDDVAMPAARTSGDELDEFKTASRIADEASARLA